MSGHVAALLLVAASASAAAFTNLACTGGSSACDSAGAEGEDHILLLQTDINILNTRSARSEALEVAVVDQGEGGSANVSEVVEAGATDEAAMAAPAETALAEEAPAELVAAVGSHPEAAARRPERRQPRRKEKRSPASLLAKHWQEPQAPPLGGGYHQDAPHVDGTYARATWSTPFAGLDRTAAWTREHFGGHGWISGMLAAAVVAMLCSGDDLVWLTPFAVHESRLFLLPFYCMCMIFIATLAWLIQVSGNFLDSHNGNVPVELIVRLITAVALFWYSSYLYQEWTKDEWTSTSKDVDSSRPSLRGNLLPPPDTVWNTLGSAQSLPSGTRRSLSPGREPSPSGMEPADATASGDLNESHRSLPPSRVLNEATWLKQASAGEAVLVSLGPVGGIPKESPYWNLFVMCVVGSIYPAIAFVTLLYSNALQGSQLVAGVALNSVLVAGFCFSVTFSRTVSALCERIPFWCVVFALGLWSLYALCQDAFAN